MNLEAHWGAPERPFATFSANPNVYEKSFGELLERFPCPDTYIKDTDIGIRSQPGGSTNSAEKARGGITKGKSNMRRSNSAEDLISKF